MQTLFSEPKGMFGYQSDMALAPLGSILSICFCEKYMIVNYVAKKKQVQYLRMTKETDWQQRYQTEDMPWDKGKPAPLMDWLQKQTLDPETRVLIPDAG